MVVRVKEIRAYANVEVYGVSDMDVLDRIFPAM